MVSAWSASTFLSVAQSKAMPRRDFYYSSSYIPVRYFVWEQWPSSCAQCMTPRVYFTRRIPKLMRPGLVVLLEKPEAMYQILLTVRPMKSSNAYSPPSSRMLLRLPSVTNPINARACSTGFLVGSGGTINAGTFPAMINMMSCTGINIIRLVSVTLMPSNRQL